MNALILPAVFWSSVAIVLYAYLGFPLLTWIRGVTVFHSYERSFHSPHVSIVVVCYNEVAVIEEKLRNLLSLAYAPDRVEIIVVSDGSTDGTVNAARTFERQGVRVVDFPRGGKAAGLNAGVLASTGDILVFTDANSMLDADALNHLVRPFADSAIGCVAGDQVYRDAHGEGAAELGERRYWDFDRWMKTLQSRSGSATSATGALYATRRELFRPIGDGVTDDFVNSTNTILAGYRLVFEPRAVCYEPVAGKVRDEFGRKVRVMTRGLRATCIQRKLLNPFRFGFYSLQLFSHKVVRRLVALPLAVLAIVSVMLISEGWIYQAAAIAQGMFYLAAITGGVAALIGVRSPKSFQIPLFFCLVNAAAATALWNLLTGKKITQWNSVRGAN